MYVHIIKAVTNGVKKCEPLNDLVEDVPVGVVTEGTGIFQTRCCNV